MRMSSHSSVSSSVASQYLSVSLSGARGDWESAGDLDQLLCALHNNIGMAMLIAHAQLGVVILVCIAGLFVASTPGRSVSN